jgi:hypothetical protein
VRRLFLFLITYAILADASALAFFGSRDLLTEKEIELVQDNREISHRTKLYMDFAAARLKAAEDRLLGKEPPVGDPFEYYTPEEMLDNYYRIVKSVISHLEDAYLNPQRNQNFNKALKSLKKDSESAGNELEILKKIAEEKKKEQLWNLINRAIEITNDAHSGAEIGLSEKSSTPSKK